MKFTPSLVIDAPSYYVDHFNGKYDTDKCTILRDLDLQSDSDAMPSCLRHLTNPTHILDLTNNNLIELPNLRNRTDIHTLLIGRNRINKNVDGKKLPINLKNLILISNNISELSHLNELRKAPKSLTNLCLRGNPICHLDGYREYIIRLLPSLNTFDFTKVSDKERLNAKKKPMEHASKNPLTPEGNIEESGDKSIDMMNFVVSKMSDERRNELKKQLSEATSLEDILKLEKLLSGGV